METKRHVNMNELHTHTHTRVISKNIENNKGELCPKLYKLTLASTSTSSFYV